MNFGPFSSQDLALFAGPNFWTNPQFRKLPIIHDLDQVKHKRANRSVLDHSIDVTRRYYALVDAGQYEGDILSRLTPLQLNLFLMGHDFGKCIDYSYHSHHSAHILTCLAGHLVDTTWLEVLCLNHLLFGFLYEGVYRWHTDLDPFKPNPNLAHFQDKMRLGPQDILWLCPDLAMIEFLIFGFMPADIASVNPAFDRDHYQQFANQWVQEIRQIADSVHLPANGEGWIQDPVSGFPLINPAFKSA